MRAISEGLRTAESIAIDLSRSPAEWAEALATKVPNLSWVLAHTESGVVWGTFGSGQLLLSVSARVLRWETLLQLRIFGEVAEVFVWRGPSGLEGRIWRDGMGAPIGYLDETQLLWGWSEQTDMPDANGFLTLIEGLQGIRQPVPLAYRPAERNRAGLRVRHYLCEDAAGVVRISGSRLVGLVEPTAATARGESNAAEAD